MSVDKTVYIGPYLRLEERATLTRIDRCAAHNRPEGVPHCIHQGAASARGDGDHRVGGLGMAELRALAASLPDLDPDHFTGILARLLYAHNFDRARKLVNALGESTLQPWVRPTAKVVVWVTKLGALAVFVWLIIWLAK